MICPKCGFNNSDLFSFCQQCGNRLTAPAEPAAPAAPVAEPGAEPVVEVKTEPVAAPVFAPADAPVADAPVTAAAEETVAFSAVASGNIGTNRPDTQGRVLKTIKRVLTSPMFIIAAIATSVAVILDAINFYDNFKVVKDVIYSGGLQGILRSDYYKLYENGNFEKAYNSGAFETPAIILLLFLVVVGAVTVIGLWSLFVSAFIRDERSIKPLGFSFLKAASTTNLILLCLGFVGFEGYMLYRYFGLYKGEENYESKVLMILMLVVFSLAIALFICIISSLSNLQRATASGSPKFGVSGFAAVVMLLYTGLKVREFVSRITYIYRFKSIDRDYEYVSKEILSYYRLSAASIACMIIAFVCFAVLLFRYKYTVKAISEAEE